MVHVHAVGAAVYQKKKQLQVSLKSWNMLKYTWVHQTTDLLDVVVHAVEAAVYQLSPQCMQPKAGHWGQESQRLFEEMMTPSSSLDEMA